MSPVLRLPPEAADELPLDAPDDAALDDDELLDDLRLAVSEACTLLLQDTDADGTITLRLGEDDQALTIDVRGMSGVPIALVGRHANDDENVVALIDVIRALVDDVIVITDDGHESLRMRLVCAPVPALP